MGTLVRLVVLGALAIALVGCSVGSPSPSSPAGSAAAAGDPLAQGIAAHNAGRIDEAIVLYHQALVKDPTNKFAFFNLGQVEHTRNHLVSAEAWYRLALETDKNMAQALYNLALIRQTVGDSAESVSLLRRLIAIDPNNGAAHWNLGLALRTLGQNAEATSEFATAQRLDARLVPPSGSVRPSPTR